MQNSFFLGFRKNIQMDKTISAHDLVKNWIEQTLKRKEMSPYRWATDAKLAPTTITRFLSGETDIVPSFKTIFSLANAANVPLPGADFSEVPDSINSIKLPVWRNPIRVEVGSVSVEEGNDPDYLFNASETWVRQWTPTHYKQLGFMVGSGAPMEPTIYDGELVLVDFSCRKYDGDGVYALHTVGDVLQLKRVIYQHDTGGYEVRTDNLRYPGFKVKPDQVDVWGKALFVVGRKID